MSRFFDVVLQIIFEFFSFSFVWRQWICCILLILQLGLSIIGWALFYFFFNNICFLLLLLDSFKFWIESLFYLFDLLYHSLYYQFYHCIINYFQLYHCWIELLIHHRYCSSFFLFIIIDRISFIVVLNIIMFSFPSSWYNYHCLYFSFYLFSKIFLCTHYDLY